MCIFPTFYRECLEVFNDCLLEQTVTSPTRGKHILDLFFTSNPTLIDSVSNLPGLSDHDIVRVLVNTIPSQTKQVPRYIPLYKKADWDQFKQTMRDFQSELSRLITLLPSLIARRLVGRQTQWWPRHKAIYFSWFGPELFCLLLGPPGFNCWFSSAPVFQWCCSTPLGSPGVGRNTFLSSPHLCFIKVFICDLFVSLDDPLMS